MKYIAMLMNGSNLNMNGCRLSICYNSFITPITIIYIMKVGNKMKMNLTGAIEILKLHKHTTDKFKHSVGDQYVSDAIDTVLSYINTENKTGLDENLLEKGIDQPDNQDVLSSKKDRLYTAEDMEEFAEWSYKQSHRMMWWNKGKYIGYSGMLKLWEQERREK